MLDPQKDFVVYSWFFKLAIDDAKLRGLNEMRANCARHLDKFDISEKEYYSYEQTALRAVSDAWNWLRSVFEKVKEDGVEYARRRMQERLREECFDAERDSN